jgi:hypothetical protein
MMKDPNVIEAEVLTILASATEQEMLSRMRVAGPFGSGLCQRHAG